MGVRKTLRRKSREAMTRLQRQTTAWELGLSVKTVRQSRKQANEKKIVEQARFLEEVGHRRSFRQALYALFEVEGKREEGEARRRQSCQRQTHVATTAGRAVSGLEAILWNRIQVSDSNHADDEGEGEAATFGGIRLK